MAQGVEGEMDYHRQPTLGKTRSKGLSFPGPDFVYGTVTAIKDGGVSEAADIHLKMSNFPLRIFESSGTRASRTRQGCLQNGLNSISHWHSYSVPGSGSGTRSKKGEKDFVALNREGVKSGLVTAKEHYQYRATHDIRRQIPAKDGSKFALTPKIPDITFGAPTGQGQEKGGECTIRDKIMAPVGLVWPCTRSINRWFPVPSPSTPISDLLEHRYYQRWLEDQQTKDRVMLEQRQKRIGPALNTFRDPEARKKAFSAHYSDSVARRGHLGQGTYNLT
ncbi:hypothetical protein JZ751_001213 [Albula glossodonta]|uniref:Cilia- and flagella-associated protein 77 n=1 Tax=Albula glossodonta TaxID=121402 RepID=A0A8T2PT22_9TELE|nr:hypothetical protein JZ751_001213 [Albula glossodonta]